MLKEDTRISSKFNRSKAPRDMDQEHIHTSVFNCESHWSFVAPDERWSIAEAMMGGGNAIDGRKCFYKNISEGLDGRWIARAEQCSRKSVVVTSLGGILSRTAGI